MDPEVSKRKFEQEVQRLDTEAKDFVDVAGWVIRKRDYPVIEIVLTHPRSGRAVGFRFTCDDWDEQAPSLALWNPDTEEVLPWDQWPQGGWAVATPHPGTGKPFLCLPGIREYHTHSSHLSTWEAAKSQGAYSLLDIIQRVHRAFLTTNG